jgi:hypothetical protein
MPRVSFDLSEKAPAYPKYGKFSPERGILLNRSSLELLRTSAKFWGPSGIGWLIPFYLLEESLD